MFTARKHRRVSSRETSIDAIRHGEKFGTVDVQLVGKFVGVSPLRKFVKDSGFNTEWGWSRVINHMYPPNSLSYNIYCVSNFKTNVRRSLAASSCVLVPEGHRDV